MRKWGGHGLGHDAGGEIVFLHFSCKNLDHLQVVGLGCGGGSRKSAGCEGGDSLVFGVLICFIVTEGSCSFIHPLESGGIFLFFFILFIFINL